MQKEKKIKFEALQPGTAENQKQTNQQKHAGRARPRKYPVSYNFLNFYSEFLSLLVIL